jgi:hypothetical protein
MHNSGTASGMCASHRANTGVTNGMVIQIRTSLDEPDTGQSFIPHRPARPEKSEGGKPFVIKSEYEPAGDQPTAIAELVAQAARRARPGAAGRHRIGQDLHDGQGHRAIAAPRADPGAQQDPRGAALRRVQELLPGQCGRILRQLLRLLPARGLCRPVGHLHREGKLGKRGDRPDAPFGHAERCWSATT